jgi:hypothetical protein
MDPHPAAAQPPSPGGPGGRGSAFALLLWQLAYAQVPHPIHCPQHGHENARQEPRPGGDQKLALTMVFDHAVFGARQARSESRRVSRISQVAVGGTGVSPVIRSATACRKHPCPGQSIGLLLQRATIWRIAGQSLASLDRRDAGSTGFWKRICRNGLTKGVPSGRVAANPMASRAS